MATRGHQGLQIGLIIFFMLTVVLGVTTYLGFKNAGEEKVKVKTEKENATKAQDLHRQALDESIRVKKALGYGDAEDIKNIEAAHVTDMKLGGDPPEADYRKLVTKLAAAIQSRDESLATVQKELQDEKDGRAADKAAADTALTDASAEYQKAVAAFAAGQKKFEADRKGLTAQNDKLQTANTTQGATFNAAKAKLEKEKKALELENKNLAIFNASQKAKIDELLGGTKGFHDFDGKITLVNQRSNTVFIDRGLEDGLRSQVSFSVYSPDDINSSNAKPKATIEVIGMPEAQSAEARLTDHDLGNPVLPGDIIYSTVWNAGQKTHIAITGFIDIDNDGKSDLAKVEALIATNGGVIDSELNVDTRYLLVGREPADKSPDFKTYSTMMGQASKLGVDQIGVPAFLSQMGYRPGQASGADSATRDAATTPAPAGFRERGAPVRSSSGGAF